MQCDILGDTIGYVQPCATPEIPTLLLPLTFINFGARSAIVEWVALRITSRADVWLYSPIQLVDLHKFMQELRVLHGSNSLGVFSEFVVGPGTEKFFAIIFTWEPGHPCPAWTPGDYRIEVLVKYRDRAAPVIQRVFSPKITEAFLAGYRGGQSTFDSMRKIDLSQL